MGVREVLERRRALGVVAGEGAPCNRDVGGVARHYYTTGIRVPQELPDGNSRLHGAPQVGGVR